MRYAFLNQDSIVVNVIVGELTPEQLGGFLDDYAKLFGATQVIPVGDDQAVWIGGSYTGGEFLPPAEPEPAPEIIEGVSEVLPEPLPEVTTETII
jgi:hypothetical protein